MKLTVLMTVLMLAASTTAAAQQADSAAQQAPVATGVTVPASSASVSSPRALPGPRLAPEFRRAEPTLGSSAAVAGSQTITISTLALVLAVIIIVLLVVN